MCEIPLQESTPSSTKFSSILLVLDSTADDLPEDIHSCWSSIVEKLEPEQTLLLLSRYFNDMSEVIDKFGGIVIEFIGDAIYAVFGAPVRNREHAEAGVNAMLKMLKTVQRINQWAKHRLLPEVSIRCGVHSGTVQVGNMGFHSRLKCGVMGAGAEIPSKLEEMNKTYGTHNLISESTFHKLPPDGYVMRPIDFVDMSHGADDPEPVYEVMSQIANSSSPSTRSSRRDTLARKYETALDMYTEKRFAKAAAQFREVSTSMGQTFGIYDKPSVLMRKRAAYYMQHPPPEGWKGVWTRTREPDETDGVEDEVVYVCV
ncbi:cya1 [Symbiodinium sp. KB8]|nr:cya1 [Symbiodinium sp. KB8]